MSMETEMTDQRATQARLEDLKSDDPVKQRAAIEALREELIEHAKRRLGRVQHHVDRQPESVVQSVLVGELPHHDRYENDAHMRGRLRRAVMSKILDRRKKGGKKRTYQLSQTSNDGTPVDPADTAAGVGTQVESLEQDELARKQVLDAQRRMLEDLDSDAQAFVRLIVIDGVSCKDAATELGITPDAARKRKQRLAESLRSKLAEPLRDQLSAEDWTLLRTCLVDRLSPNDAAALAGCTVEQLVRRYSDLFANEVGPLLGPDAIEYMERLLR
jgi:DNA-directed RNA polymerase specialized sigma24 family protein